MSNSGDSNPTQKEEDKSAPSSKPSVKTIWVQGKRVNQSRLDELDNLAASEPDAFLGAMRRLINTR